MLMQLPNGTWISTTHVTAVYTKEHGASFRVVIEHLGPDGSSVWLVCNSETEAKQERDRLAKDINARRAPVR